MAAVRRLAAAELPPAAGPVADATPLGAGGVAAELVVLPGVSPRRLAAVVAPAVGESLPSWVDRVAAGAGVSAGQMALALGLQVRDQPGDVRPLFYGTVLTAASRAGLVAATGLAGQELAALHLSRFDGTALDFSGLDVGDERTIQPLVAREWALFHGSRACPACLAGSGGVWSLWWRLGVAAVCPRHGVLLVDVCPGCGVRLRRGYASHPGGLSRVRAVDLARCGNYRPGGGVCGHRLDEVPAVAVGQSLVDAQRQVLAVAFGAVAVVAGRPVASAVWFAALRYLAALVRFAAEPADVAAAVDGLPSVVSVFGNDREERLRAKAGTPTALRRMPATAALAAAVTAVVLPVLAAADPDMAAARLAPLAEAATRRRRQARHDPLRTLASPAPLATLLHTVTPPASRVVGAIPSTGTLGRVGWQVRHLPHLVDAGDYAVLVAGYLPKTAAPSGRRMTALALARLAGAPSWRKAAEAMGMAARWVSLDSYLSRRITDAAGFWAAAGAVGQRLVGRGLVDYAVRRHALAGLLEVPHAVLFAVCHPLGLPVTQARCQHAAAWVWEHYTGGDVREAPALTELGAVVADASTREVHRRFVRWLPAPVAVALHAWAVGFLAAREAG